MEKRKSKIERANDVGIYLRNYDIGEQRIICPTCSPTRKKRNDNCLAITITDDAILWFCHHCEWQGGAKDGDNRQLYKPRPLPVREYQNVFTPVVPIVSSNNHDLSESSIAWLHNRKISQETAETFKLFTKDQKLCFPYY